jgi:hypothetical protein
MNTKRLIKGFMAGAILCAGNLTQFFCCSAQAAFFTIPYDATLYLTALGGSAAGTTEFGLGTSQANARPMFTGLPNSPNPLGEVEIGFFAAGATLDFYQQTEFGGTYWAFSVDTTSDASRYAFIDVDNSIGLSGSIVEPIDPTTWLLHLDDAASFLVDDDDDDVLIQIRVNPIPEPTGAMLLLLSGGLLLLPARRRGVWAGA